MDFEFTPEEKAYQQELCDFLKKEVNEGVIAETCSMQGMGPYSRELLLKLGERRLLAPSWPKQYGGRGLSHVAQYIMLDEMSYHMAPYPLDGIVIGPSILRFGSDRQKEKYLPRIASGQIEFALGYTEPQAGSDLASLEIRAVENGDEYVISGQKVFNTEAHYADYHWLAARTDVTVPKHRGLSLFIVDLKSPSITIRPLITMAGLRTNEVFYDNMRVPKDDLVGEKNQGWNYIMTALNFERTLAIGDIKEPFDKMVEYVLEAKQHDNTSADTSWVWDKLAQLSIELHIGRLLIYRVACMLNKGAPVVYESSLAKVFICEMRRRLFSAAMQILGPYGQLSEGSKLVPLGGRILRNYLDSPRWNIVAGTSEVQRNIIALRGLGLPRE
jgi:hypothetical protein